MPTPNLPAVELDVAVEFDARFDPTPEPPAATGVKPTTAQSRKWRAAQKARATRAAIVATAAPALTAMGLPNPATRRDLAKFLAVGESTIRMAVGRNAAELSAAGYADDAFPPAAAATLILTLRPQASANVAAVQRFLAPDLHPTRITTDGGEAHRARAAGVLGDAAELAADVRDVAADDVWARVHALDAWRKTAMVIALAAMVPDDHPGPRAWLKRLDPDRHSHPLGGAAANGLATLLATPETADGAPLSAIEIDDEAVGL